MILASMHVSASDFARATGVTVNAVTQAIKTGRLTAKKERGKWMLDPVVAAQEWSENSKFRIEAAGAIQLKKTIDAAPMRTIVDSRAVREDYEARLAQLKYETATGELVRADEVESAWGSIITSARTRLLAVPSRAKIQMPGLTAEQIEVIEELIREALEELSNDGGRQDTSPEDEGDIDTDNQSGAQGIQPPT